MSRKTQLAAAALLFAVLVVSAYDGYRCVVDIDDLPITEKNPLARWLIHIGGVELLVGCKVFGTGAVAAVVAVMIKDGWKRVWYVLSALTIVQIIVVSHYLYGMFP